MGRSRGSQETGRCDTDLGRKSQLHKSDVAWKKRTRTLPGSFCQSAKLELAVREKIHHRASIDEVAGPENLRGVSVAFRVPNDPQERETRGEEGTYV